MARHRSHSIEFKRQVAQEFIAGETLHALARRHDVSRNLIRVWVKKLETGAFDDDARAAARCRRLHGDVSGFNNPERAVPMLPIASGCAATILASPVATLTIRSVGGSSRFHQPPPSA